MGSGKPPLPAALDAARTAQARLRAACDLATQAVTALETGVQTPVEGPLNAPENDIVMQHRRLHKRGVPSPLDADPDLAAFAATCLETMTFAQAADTIAARFPEGRRTSQSSLHRWWHRQRRTAQSAVTSSS